MSFISNTCTSLSTLSCKYLFQMPADRLYGIQNYLRLKINKNNPKLYEAEKLNKPLYIFRPQASNETVETTYGGRIPIYSYDFDTLTYALSYNANVKALLPAINNNRFVTINKGLTGNVNNRVQATPVGNVSAADAYVTAVNYSSIPIRSFNKTAQTFNFYQAQSSLMNSLLSGNFNTEREVFLSGFIYDAINYTPGIIFPFLVKVLSRSGLDGEIGYDPIEGLTSPLLFNLLSADDTYNVGHVQFNSITVSQELWGKSYYVPASSAKFNYTTTSLVSTNIAGLKAPEEFPFIVSSYAIRPYGQPSALTGTPITWDMSNGAATLTTLAKDKKIYLSSYDHTTQTYTVSAVFPWIWQYGYDSLFFYPLLKTKVYRNNRVKDVIIKSVQYQNGTFTTFDDVWGESYENPVSAIERNYILDKQKVVTDSAAGTMKIFRKDASNSNLILSSCFDVIYPGLSTNSITLSSYCRTYPFFNGNIIRDKGELSGYSIPYALYFKQQNFKYRYYYDNPDDPPARWLYSKKNAFTEYQFQTIPLTSVALPFVADTLYSNNAQNLYYAYYHPYPNLNYDYNIITYAHTVTSNTNIPYRVGSKMYDKDGVEINSVLYVPLSVNFGEPPGLHVTTYDLLCAATSGNSTFGKYVAVAGNEFSTGHVTIVDPYTKDIHVYLKNNFGGLYPYTIIPYVSCCFITPSLSLSSINVVEIGKNIKSKVSDEASYVAVDYKYEHWDYPGIYHNLIVVYKLAHTSIVPFTGITRKPPIIYTYNSYVDPELNFANNNSEITSMEFLIVDNETKKSGIRKLLAVGRAFNTYYSPYSGTVEIHSYDNGKGKTAVIQNYRSNYYLGTEIDCDTNLVAVTLSAKNSNNKNLVNLYTLSSYYIRNPIPQPAPSPTPTETQPVTPTPSITPSPTPTQP